MTPPAILFRDRRFLIIDKPAGMPVHADRANSANIEDFFPQWRQGRSGPWLAHRLDRDTSGCLVVALKKSALLAAQRLFADGEVRKTYWALTAGAPAAPEGVIDQPLAKVRSGREWRMAPAGDGAAARTRWRLRGQAQGIGWLELHPETGRTHQVRAHCAAIGTPILGDAVYGGGGGPLCLLARAVTLKLDPAVSAIAPPPSHMREGLASCGWIGEDDQKRI